MLFAVAYQNLSTHKGFITCWNVQNINYPELVISTSTNPTTIRFSVDNPRLLATGDESGMVRFLSLSTSSGHCPENRVLSKKKRREEFKEVIQPNTILLQAVVIKVASLTCAGSATKLWAAEVTVAFLCGQRSHPIWRWNAKVRTKQFFADVALKDTGIAELLPSYYNLELPRPVESTLLSQPDCLPTSAARCCAAPLKSDPDHFIIGSEDGSLHTVLSQFKKKITYSARILKKFKMAQYFCSLVLLFAELRTTGNETETCGRCSQHGK